MSPADSPPFPRRIPCRLLPLAAVVACLLTLGAPRAAAEDPPPTLPATPAPGVEAALPGLRSPFLREREAAVRSLAASLPASAEALRTAFRRETNGAVRLHLAEVLVRDPSAASLGLLFEAVLAGPEPASARIRFLLTRDPEPVAIALAAWARGRGLPDPWPEPLRALEDLLVRAEVERLFVARKSATGYTGYYQGQYAPLDTPRLRATAVRLCVALLADRALRVPGSHRAGGFEFLIAPDQTVEFEEFQGMAANAVTELLHPGADPVDDWALGELQDLLSVRRYEHQTTLLVYDRDTTHENYLEMLAARGAFADLLLSLALLRPVRYRRALDTFLDELAEGNLRSDLDLYASMLLRVGRYAEAVREFEKLASNAGDSSPANLHYNLACAYASWSLAPDAEDPAELRRRALLNLKTAVYEHRWSDIGWMEQDRDLDPIRDTQDYRDLVAHIREFILPPPPK